MQLSPDRRRFLKHVGGLCGAFPVAFWAAQHQGRGVRRIGFIIGSTTPSLIEAFRDALSSLGHIEGKNLLLDLRVVSSEDMPKHAAELAKSDLELVVAASLPSALEIRRANPAMPMVIATCPGMVSNGFAKSLEHPGGNVTGMEELPPGVTAKRLTC